MGTDIENDKSGWFHRKSPISISCGMLDVQTPWLHNDRHRPL